MNCKEGELFFLKKVLELTKSSHLEWERQTAYDSGGFKCKVGDCVMIVEFGGLRNRQLPAMKVRVGTEGRNFAEAKLLLCRIYLAVKKTVDRSELLKEINVEQEFLNKAINEVYLCKLKDIVPL